MKKIVLLILITVPFIVFAQSNKPLSRKEKAAEKKGKINQLIKQEEEGALIYQKQGAFGIKLNTDGYGFFYEHGRYKTITKTNIWWMEFGEHKSPKQEKQSQPLTNGIVLFSGTPYVYGKQNNFYYFKLGFGSQVLIGGKGNKNGVAVSAIYGGGLSLGMLKPYYIQIQDPVTGKEIDIKYNNNDSLFLNDAIIFGGSSFGKGFNEMQFVPGANIRTALRFDYGRYNEVLSAIEVGLNFEYYSQLMPIMVKGDPHHAFLNAYISIEFGKRK